MTPAVVEVLKTSENYQINIEVKRPGSVRLVFFDSKPFPNVQILNDVDDRERLVRFTSNYGGMFTMNNNQTNDSHNQTAGAL